MGVYIKDMEMPSGCISCDFCNPFVEEPYCRRLMKRVPKVTRLDNCPLVPVPPHGDLIDRKALLADTTDMLHSMMVFGGARVYTSDAIKNAPTVIEAEGGE